MGPRTKPNIMNMILLWEVWQSPWTYFQLFIPILIGSLVVGCVAADEMPPKKKKRLDVAKQSAFLKDLESSLVAFDRDHGKIVLRRLNRTQYENTINAMSGWLHMVLDEELPPDAVGRAHRLLCRGGAKRSAYCPTTKT